MHIHSTASTASPPTESFFDNKPSAPAGGQPKRSYGLSSGIKRPSGGGGGFSPQGGAVAKGKYGLSSRVNKAGAPVRAPSFSTPSSPPSTESFFDNKPSAPAGGQPKRSYGLSSGIKRPSGGGSGGGGFSPQGGAVAKGKYG